MNSINLKVIQMIVKHLQNEIPISNVIKFINATKVTSMFPIKNNAIVEVHFNSANNFQTQAI